ncbi:hypothetical protein KRM28CT15_52990 [Krasilnikovia sp. M28-CT-15]
MARGFAGVLVNDVQEADLPAVGSDIDLEVEGPHLVRDLGPHPLMPRRATPPFPTDPGRTLEPQLDPQQAGALPVEDQPFPGGDRMRLTPPPPRILRGCLP